MWVSGLYLGLTPQAKYLSPLRGSQPDRPAGFVVQAYRLHESTPIKDVRPRRPHIHSHPSGFALWATP